MTVIDVHAHIIPRELTRDANPDEAWRPRLRWEDGVQILNFMSKSIRSAVREFVNIERILEEQTRAGVDKVVLAPWVPMLRYNTAPQEGLRVCRIQNEALATLAQNHEAVLALGAVPLQDPVIAARELIALMQVDGIYGVEVAASVNGVYLGDPRFEPFWAAANASGAVVFIHPTTRGFELPVLNEYYLWNTVGNPTETAITAAHMVMAGVMEKHPTLKVVLAHGGGALMTMRGRLRHAHSFQPSAKAVLTEDVDVSLRRFYYDSLTHDADLLHALIDYAGPHHVMVGSDYPFDMGDARPADIVRSLGLNADTEQKILGGNAEKLFTK